jgi:type IV pilus assembly protein PilA
MQGCGAGRQRNITMKTRGFSMIELVMMLAVVAILAVMAVPTFIDRNIRLQVQEGMAMASLAMNGVQSFYVTPKNKNEFPANNEEAGIPPKDKIVSNLVAEVNIDAGAVTITFGNNVNGSITGKRLTLRPIIVKDFPAVSMDWICNKAAVPKEMTAIGENRTDIPAKWLPIKCRG